MNTPHPSVLRSLDTSGFGHLQDNIVSDEAETSPERTPRQVLSRHRCAQSIVSVAASGAEGGDAIAWVSTCFVVLPQKRQTHGVAGGEFSGDESTEDNAECLFRDLGSGTRRSEKIGGGS
ncbi:hypothetical protein Landi51_09021 [Colletotrichum acutatum]